MTRRLLPPNDWHRLPKCAELGALVDRLRPDIDEVIVVEDGERIVGCWALIPVMLAEGAWIDPAYRRSGSVARQGLRLLFERIRSRGFVSFWTGAVTRHVRLLCHQLGGTRVPADLYAIEVPSWPSRS